MRFLAISDFHLLSKQPIGRIDPITTKQWEKLEYIFRFAQERGIDLILQAGDLFDRPRDWNVLSKFIETKSRFPDITLCSVYGQHDMYYRNVDSVGNMSILERIGMIKILGNNPFVVDGWNIYGVSFGDDIPKPEGKSILVIHAPITDTNMPLATTSPFMFIKENKFDFVLCGDIHKPFLVKHKKRIIANTGSIVRHSRDEAHTPTMLLVDNMEVEMIHVTRESPMFMSEPDETSIALDCFIDNLNRKQSYVVNVIEMISRTAAELPDGNVKKIIFTLLNGGEIE